MGRGLGWVTHRGPFQSQFCDSSSSLPPRGSLPSPGPDPSHRPGTHTEPPLVPTARPHRARQYLGAGRDAHRLEEGLSRGHFSGVFELEGTFGVPRLVPRQRGVLRGTTTLTPFTAPIPPFPPAAAGVLRAPSPLLSSRTTIHSPGCQMPLPGNWVHETVANSRITGGNLCFPSPKSQSKAGSPSKGPSEHQSPMNHPGATTPSPN